MKTSYFRIILSVLFALYTILASISMLVPIFRKEKNSITRTIYYSCVKSAANGKAYSQLIYGLNCGSLRFLLIFALFSNAVGTASCAMSFILSIIHYFVIIEVSLVCFVVLFSFVAFFMFTMCSLCMICLYYASFCQSNILKTYSFKDDNYEYASGFYLMILVSLGSVVAFIMAAYLASIHPLNEKNNDDYRLQEYDCSQDSQYYSVGSYRGMGSFRSMGSYLGNYEDSDDDVVRF
ncbi:unnamed protein product [Phytomonas sp. Hart1]|nr:unnamed protein product [Phytomonas sp. Hart1]|eukprot:CCW69216.1 unnamed protein product [Phytomonas sp. isolate Hart1]